MSYLDIFFSNIFPMIYHDILKIILICPIIKRTCLDFNYVGNFRSILMITIGII